MSRPESVVWLDEFLAAHVEELIAFRRHLHMHPELSGEEHETSELIAARLEVAGLEPRILTGGAGVLCDVGPVDDGGVVALRADLDALAMTDEKDVHYASQVPGVAHACGHDVHTTVVLGAGLALARRFADGRDERARGARLIFESAEETVPGGALDAIAAGALEGVSAIYGLHCDPRIDVGEVGLRAGPITSAADMVEIRLHGPGGHTARPERTVDLLGLAGRVVTELPGLLADRVRDGGAVSLVFGSLHAGDAPNVIPAFAVLRGSLRSPDRDAWDAVPPALESAVASIVDPTGAEAEILHTRGVPPVVNDERATERLAAAARRVLGPDAVVPTVQSAGGDDFSWYLERVAGAYARLGVHDPAQAGERLDLHASHFDVDERAIEAGVRVLTEVALATPEAR